MSEQEQGLDSTTKVPEVTIVFWIIKIAATTLGETAGDSVTMTLNWGYLAGTALFLGLLVLLILAQILAKEFHPVLYWATIVASTTFGTTMADFADRSLGIGYPGGSALLLALLLSTLTLWYCTLGSIAVETVNTPRAEAFYWAAITFPKRWALLWGTGWRTRWVLAMTAERSYSLADWRCSRRVTTGQTFLVYCCSGPHSF
jgi:uncharacterized membrane-anchored protein